jgi:deoxyribonuclease IV
MTATSAMNTPHGSLPLIGAHVRENEPLGAAADTTSGCIQLFCGDPQSWKPWKPRADSDALRTCGIPVYVHAPYIVNLASADNKIRIPSRKALQAACDCAVACGAQAVVVHGGHVRSDDDIEEGIARWVKGLASIESDMAIYLENTAGGDHAMARRWDNLARLWDAIAVDPRVGFCLDTCHTFASGEDLASSVERLQAITGRIDLVHCNGSRDAEGSGRDRHQNFAVLGTDNTVSPKLLVDIVRSAGAPVICETPEEGLTADVTFLRDALAAGL